MTESHPKTHQAAPAGTFFVSSRVTKAIRRQHQADVASCEEEATYVILTAASEAPSPWPGTFRPDFYSSEADGDHDRKISNGLPYTALCAYREIRVQRPH